MFLFCEYLSYFLPKPVCKFLPMFNYVAGIYLLFLQISSIGLSFSDDKMGRKNLPKEEVDVRVDFPVSIDDKTFLKLVIDLAKNLLLQKNQIPLQYEAIAKEVELEAKLVGALDSEKDSDENEEIPTKDRVREKLKRTRARKSKLQLVKNGEKLIEDFAQLESDLGNELDHGDVDSISFLFGATVHSAREVYTVNVPNNLNWEPGAGQPQSRLGLHLYRAMMSHDSLHDITSSRLPISNMFLMISRTSLSFSSSLIHLPDYSLPSPARGSLVVFQFSCPDQVAAKVASDSCQELRTNLADMFPQSMELCTPFTQGKYCNCQDLVNLVE